MFDDCFYFLRKSVNTPVQNTPNRNAVGWRKDTVHSSSKCEIPRGFDDEVATKIKNIATLHSLVIDIPVSLLSCEIVHLLLWAIYTRQTKITSPSPPLFVLITISSPHESFSPLLSLIFDITPTISMQCPQYANTYQQYPTQIINNYYRTNCAVILISQNTKPTCHI